MLYTLFRTFKVRGASHEAKFALKNYVENFTHFAIRIANLSLLNLFLTVRNVYEKQNGRGGVIKSRMTKKSYVLAIVNTVLTVHYTLSPYIYSPTLRGLLNQQFCTLIVRILMWRGVNHEPARSRLKRPASNIDAYHTPPQKDKDWLPDLSTTKDKSLSSLCY